MAQAHLSHPVRVRLPTLSQVWRHAQSQPEQEVCGILLGALSPGLTVRDSVEATNILGMHDRYMIDAATLLAADDRARAAGQHIIGFYHSHPGTLPILSPTDRQAAWPGYLYVIVTSGHDRSGALCGWFVDDAQRIQPALLEIMR
jgi:proteasome lid subunit RPN8/RPN11